MIKGKIAITTTSFAEYDELPLNILSEHGYLSIINPFARKLKPQETIELCKGCIGIVAGTEQYDRGVIAGLPALRAISRCGVGIDGIDMEAAGAASIKVVNTPDGPTLAVAELTVSVVLALLRLVVKMDRDMRAGTWKKLMGNLLHKKKIGIIGFGRIGQKTAGLLSGFGVELAYYDKAAVSSDIPAIKMELDELLGWSDIICIHISTKTQVIGKTEFECMKSDAYIINMSRGGVISEEALYIALKENKLAGAALDVFEKEPYSGPLMELDNVILTPHIGSYAKESRIEMEVDAVKNLIEAIR